MGVFLFPFSVFTSLFRPRLTTVPLLRVMFLYDLESALAGWSRLCAFPCLPIIFHSLFYGATSDSHLEKADWSGPIDGVLARFLCDRKTHHILPASPSPSRFMSLPPLFQHPGLLSPTLTDPEALPHVLLDI